MKPHQQWVDHSENYSYHNCGFFLFGKWSKHHHHGSGTSELTPGGLYFNGACGFLNQCDDAFSVIALGWTPEPKHPSKRRQRSG